MGCRRLILREVPPSLGREETTATRLATLGVDEAGPQGQEVDGGLMSDLLLISTWRNAHRQG